VCDGADAFLVSLSVKGTGRMVESIFLIIIVLALGWLTDCTCGS
jgi:hypothetical protein